MRLDRRLLSVIIYITTVIYMSSKIITSVNFFLAIVIIIIYNENMPKTMSRNTVADKIKEERDKAGWTQTELAKRATITPSALSQIESGERYPSTIVLTKLAKALSVSVDYLLGSKESEMLDVLHNDTVKELFSGFKELSADNKDIILKQIEWLRSQQKK